MAFLSQGSASTTQAPNYTGVEVQTSVNTLPIPVMWGNARFAPNLIWYGGFNKKPAQNQGGKGGSNPTQYDYFASLILALCEGPISGIGQCYVNSQEVTTLTGLGFSLTLGYSPQPPWSYLEATHPDQVLGYNGTAYVMQGDYALGSTPSIPNHNFQVYGDTSFFAAWSYDSVDADPALVIRDFLTNPQYGVPGFPSSSIDLSTLLSSAPVGSTVTDGSLQTYLAAIELSFSPCLNNQETAQSILQRWCRLLNVAPVWSGTRLKFIPYGDTRLSRTAANGMTYVYLPNVTPVYDLDDDDFVGDASQDPVQISRTDPADAYNVVRVECCDISMDYAYAPVESRDQNAIETFGMRIAPTVTAHEFTSPSKGQIAGQLILQRGLYIRNTYTFKLSWEFCLLEPMDLVTLTDPNIGLAKTVVRITGIEEDEQGELTVTAEEFPAGIATAALYATQSSTSTFPNQSVAAEPVNVPVILEPSSLLVTSAQVWTAVSGGAGGVADPNWGGADVYISFDDVSYTQIGKVTAPARQGVLSSSLAAPSGGNPDLGNTLAVDLSMSAGVLASGTNADAQAGRTLAYVDGELLAFATASLVSATATNEAHTVPATALYLLDATHASTWVSDGGVAYSGGGSLTVTAPVSVASEAHAIPTAAGYQVSVTGAPFIADAGVAYAAGGSFTVVAGNPSAGQYVNLGNGNYQFSRSDAGTAILISYSYADPASGHYTVAAGAYWFNAADAGAAVKLTYGYDSPYHYALTYLERGLYGTLAGAHASGSQFARLDQAVFRYELPSQYVGTEIWLKFVSFNIFGQGYQDIASCVAYPYTPNGAGIAPVLAYLLNGDTAPSGVIVDQSGIAVQVNTAR